MMTAALCFFYNIHEICDLTIYKSLCPANTAWIQVQCSLLSASILRHFDLLFWHALSIFLQPLLDFNFSCLQFRDLPFFCLRDLPVCCSQPSLDFVSIPDANCFRALLVLFSRSSVFCSQPCLTVSRSALSIVQDFCPDFACLLLLFRKILMT